jgi:hypothetical protein
MSSQTNDEPEPNGSGRRGWWGIAALVGVAAIALAIYFIASPDETPTTDTAPAEDSSEMDDDMSSESPMDEPTDDMSTDMPTDDATDEMSDDDMSDDEMNDEEAAPGVYRDYSEDLLAEPGYERNIIFVHAGWCPECKAFEESLNAADIPDGVQFLKIDYDDNRDELDQRYGVKKQSTFVEVDDEGEKVSFWVGYGQDRSLDTIFDGLADGTDG